MSTTSFPSVDDYAAADVATKARIRADVTAAMHAAIDGMDLDGAKSARDMLAAYTANRTPEKVAPDYPTIAAVRIATLRAAADMIESGEVDPDGFPEGWASSNDDGDGLWFPEVDADMDAARRIAAAKVTRSTVRNDIGAAIAEVVAEVDASGVFLSCADIARKADLPSVGAVAAWLFPKGTPRTDDKVSGFVVVDRTTDHPKGIVTA